MKESTLWMIVIFCNFIFVISLDLDKHNSLVGIFVTLSLMIIYCLIRIIEAIEDK